MNTDVLARLKRPSAVFFDQEKKRSAPATGAKDVQKSRTLKSGAGKSWLSVGVKLIIGVGLVSCLCMGFLVYNGWQTGLAVQEKTRGLLGLTARLNSDLRERIASLQANYLLIPSTLSVDLSATIQEQVLRNHRVEGQETLEGRSRYGRFFNRKERRDIAKGGFVVLNQDGRLILAQGLIDETGAFADKVRMVYLSTSDPGKDADALRKMIATEQAAADDPKTLAVKIADLKARLADEALAAETERTQILYHVDQIKAEEAALQDFRQNRQRTAFLLAAVTLGLNLLVLYILTFSQVERPLKRLTRTLEQIHAGQDAAVPYQGRTDRIGLLASALQSFKGALQHLRETDAQKKKEGEVIQDLILSMTGLIEGLRIESRAMKSASNTLCELAGNTSQQSDSAAEAIQRTEENAKGVARAADRLTASVHDIHDQVGCQNDLMAEILAATGESQARIQDLNQASEEIGEIIKLVKRIAGQTKLLALNARIEASRAGGAGKGFAVVANEVRDLSIQAESANQEIATKIFAIQKACTLMTGSSTAVEGLIATLSQAGGRIYEAVKDQRKIFEGIVKNASDTSWDAQDLSGRVATVKAAAGETRRLSEKVRVDASQMEASLDHLLSGTKDKLAQISTSGLHPNRSLT